MNSGLGQDGEVEVEEADVDGRRNDADDGRLNEELGRQADGADGLVGQPGPEVPQQDGGAEAAGVERQVLDAEIFEGTFLFRNQAAFSRLALWH